MYSINFLFLSPTIVVGYDVNGPSFAPYILPCGSAGSGLYASSKEIKDGGYLTSDDGKSGMSDFFFSWRFVTDQLLSLFFLQCFLFCGCSLYTNYDWSFQCPLVWFNIKYLKLKRMLFTTLCLCYLYFQIINKCLHLQGMEPLWNTPLIPGSFLLF